MAITCRCKCLTQFKFHKQGGNKLLYSNGAKRCEICEGKYIKWDGIWCPCCGGRLRLKPRNSKLKKRLLENNSIKHI